MKAWRQQRGLTQPQAATICGVDAMQWSKWERGALRPGPRNQDKLAKGTRSEVARDLWKEAGPLSAPAA